MKKPVILLLFIALIALTSCSTTEDVVTKSTITEVNTAGMSLADQLEDLFGRFSEYKGTVFMGVSGPYQNREKAIEAATESAAEMAAISEMLTMTEYTGYFTNSAKNDYNLKVVDTGMYEEEYYNKVAREIKIKEIIWYGGSLGAVVFAEYGSNAPVNIDTTGWEEKLPETSSGMLSIGSSKRKYYIQSSLNSAAFSAAVSALNNNADSTTLLSSVDVFYDTDKTIGQLEINRLQLNHRVFRNFRILEYSYDPATSTIRALAFAY